MGSLKEVKNMVLSYLEEQIIDVEEFRLLYEKYRKWIAQLNSLIFIRWLMVYPLSSDIQRLNDQGQLFTQMVESIAYTYQFEHYFRCLLPLLFMHIHVAM